MIEKFIFNRQMPYAYRKTTVSIARFNNK